MRKAKSSPTLGTLNSHVTFVLKASRLCKLFHYLINKECSGVQSFVFITTRKDRPCSLRVDPPSGATTGNPLPPKNSHFSKHAFFQASSKKRTVT
jgi:hypothetical protein